MVDNLKKICYNKLRSRCLDGRLHTYAKLFTIIYNLGVDECGW